jgi:hypothetical protein
MQRFERRKKIVEWMIKLKANDPASDVEVWRWLGRLLKYLRADGMSSDESSVEGLETVYRVKIIIWRRREVDKYLDIIDQQRWVDADIWAGRGFRVRRMRIRSLLTELFATIYRCGISRDGMMRLMP